LILFRSCVALSQRGEEVVLHHAALTPAFAQRVEVMLPRFARSRALAHLEQGVVKRIESRRYLLTQARTQHVDQFVHQADNR